MANGNLKNLKVHVSELKVGDTCQLPNEGNQVFRFLGKNKAGSSLFRSNNGTEKALAPETTVTLYGYKKY